MRPEETASSQVRAELRSAIERLLALHRLSVAGSNDSPEADQIREQLDGFWENLTDDEQKLFRGLSSDLNWIERGPAPRLDSSMPAEVDLRALAAAVEARRWQEVLVLTRKCARAIPPTGLAHFRGNAWIGLGFPEVACLFREHAHRLDPGDENFAYLFLDLLGHANPEKLRELSRKALENPDERLLSEVIKAVSVSLEEVVGSHTPDLKEMLESHLRILERVLVRIRILLPDQVPPLLHSLACGLAGFCWDKLGHPERAEAFYDEALNREPDHDGLRITRGILNYPRKKPAALVDFREAIRLGTRMVWPYLFLAHHCLVEGRYEECLTLATQGSTRARAPRIQAELLEWSAISLCEIGGAPPEVIQGLFTAASRLAPDNPRIATNWKTFEESLLGRGSPNLQREDEGSFLKQVAGEYNPLPSWTPQELKVAA